MYQCSDTTININFLCKFTNFQKHYSWNNLHSSKHPPPLTPYNKTTPLQSLLRLRGKETRPQIGQSVPRVRRVGTRTASRGHRELRQQGLDGQLHVQGQHRLNRRAHRTRSSLWDCNNKRYIIFELGWRIEKLEPFMDNEGLQCHDEGEDRSIPRI